MCEEEPVELASVNVIGIVLVHAGLVTFLKSDVREGIRPQAIPVDLVEPGIPADVQTAPYLCGNLCASISFRKPRSLKTRVEEGTRDSPTWGRSKISRSKTTQEVPALAR